jgi:hypothetical protein
MHQLDDHMILLDLASWISSKEAPVAHHACLQIRFRPVFTLYCNIAWNAAILYYSHALCSVHYNNLL